MPWLPTIPAAWRARGVRPVRRGDERCPARGRLAALDQVPRHSPLAPWKLLIRALDAYYRRADGAALANLDAIPPRAAPARLVPVLRHLIGEPGALDQRSPRSAP